MTSKLLEAHMIRSFVSPVGALAGVLRYLKDVRPFYYLMGLSGFAFRINIGDGVCPSSPCAFHWDHFLARALMLLGYDCETVQSFGTSFLFERHLSDAHTLIQKSINSDVPVVAWELDLPEFGVIRGYDDEQRIYFTDTLKSEEGEQTLAFDKLGRQRTESLFVLSCGGRFEVDELVCAKRAIEYAIFHHRLEAPLSKSYETGAAAFGKWMDSLSRREFDPFGNSYNARVVLDCRVAAARYLEHVAPLFPQTDAILVREAAHHFAQVADIFMVFSGVFTFPGDESQLKSEVDLRKGVGWISRARAEEQKAIESLEKVNIKWHK